MTTEQAPDTTNVFTKGLDYRQDINQFLAYLHTGRVLASHTSFQKKGESKPHRHINEAIIYWISGKGRSLVEPVGGTVHWVEWEAGTTIFVPPFARHGHVVESEEARYIAVTARGDAIMQLYKDALVHNRTDVLRAYNLPTLDQIRAIAAREENISDRQFLLGG
jgi:oxalate decarboxylase/phosphoglucose isomerase-like protein (cupin superfamily)